MKSNDWVSVNDNLPEAETDVLLKFEANLAVGFLRDGDWFVNTGNGMCTDVLPYEDQPLSWMHLPV